MSGHFYRFYRIAIGDMSEVQTRGYTVIVAPFVFISLRWTSVILKYSRFTESIQRQIKTKHERIENSKNEIRTNVEGSAKQKRERNSTERLLKYRQAMWQTINSTEAV